MNMLRSDLGVCPQHNVLFLFLTVKEHLELYAGFKGIARKDIEPKVSKMLHEMELIPVQD